MRHQILSLACIFIAAVFPEGASAQLGGRTITTGASFLLLSPDARTTGVAEASTGLLPDANAVFTNAAKLNFAGDKGLSFSYTPWMRQLVKDEHLGYLTAFHRLSQREVLGVSVKYLDMGEISFRNEMGNLSQRYNAGEISIDASYSRLLGDHFAMALTARYVHSNLGSGVYNGLDMDQANAFAMDVGIYSEKSYVNSKQFSKRFAWGLNLSNIGTKLNYTNAKESFLPMNLRLGAGYGLNNNPNNRLTLLFDVTKLLVPSRPQYRVNEQGNVTTEIEKGRDPDRSVSSALFTSFYGELVEFMTSGPIVAAILEKDNAVEGFRTLIGATDPSKAEAGTIRNKYAKSIDANAIHGSDSDENAAIEGNFFFSQFERF